MTTDDFRHMALSLPGAEELNGLGYPNFRAGRKSFATIENSMAVIRLTRDQQATFVAAAPKVFEPVSGGWGRLGTTVIRLDVADGATVQDALATAWCNVADVASVLDADIADAVEAVGVASVNDVASVLDLTKSAEAADVVDAASVVDAVDVTETAEAADFVDAARVVNVEPYDHLKSVIERLQVCW
jgi:hypothetical protein